MDYKDDLDRMDLSAVQTSYESKRVTETPFEKSMKKAVRNLAETTERVAEGQVMQSAISYESAKALYEKEQNPNVVIVPVVMRGK